MFTSVDCTGQGYVYSGGEFVGGIVLSSPVGLVMALAETTATYEPMGSRADGPGMCTNVVGLSQWVIPGSPADPAATALSGVPYKPPLSTQILPDSALLDVIFFDTFDGGY